MVRKSKKIESDLEPCFKSGGQVESYHSNAACLYTSILDVNIFTEYSKYVKLQLHRLIQKMKHPNQHARDTQTASKGHQHAEFHLLSSSYVSGEQTW